jgi:hypothetical protein
MTGETLFRLRLAALIAVAFVILVVLIYYGGF